MELHEENAFKIRGYQSAIISIEREGKPLANLELDELQKIPSVGKSIAEAILSIIASGSHALLDKHLEETPKGILEVMQIKGLGPKKIKTLWKELNITSVHELMEACQSGQVAKIKGFGQKTQDSIVLALEYKASNQGKWLYAEIELPAKEILAHLSESLPEATVALVGDFEMEAEIIESLTFLIGSDNSRQTITEINNIDGLIQDINVLSPYRWEGHLARPEVKILITIVPKKEFIKQKLLKSASKAHLLSPTEKGQPLGELFYKATFNTEEAAYEAAGLPFIPAPLREGTGELEWVKTHSLDELLTLEDLKGPLHNHSTYSDGKNTLKEMSEFCQSEGYGYFGIADHSRSAFYANGLDEDRIHQQHKEIDSINESLAPFRVFKGIESDILTDGSLDYSDEVLATFDYIVASVHSGLSMDINKATARLLKAIENPYTTILGHPTGRLLLRREGYPIDHRAVIDACAINKVVIEINANPWRLDLDWRWVRYAMDQGVMLSINPDAHEKAGIAHMKFGVIAGRKGGLTKEMTLNTKNGEELASYFENRKRKKQ
ncbi:helix-hairpin-helix domain-containing protein [uncultured Cyclobacterium sp.]|uniref:DNA polymerase/3'-5' exonuclease PolX n=1 Tax=uncultured Cyclobacterium sp. TaxID=453820 RepID=UPI0030EB975C